MTTRKRTPRDKPKADPVPKKDVSEEPMFVVEAVEVEAEEAPVEPYGLLIVDSQGVEHVFGALTIDARRRMQDFSYNLEITPGVVRLCIYSAPNCSGNLVEQFFNPCRAQVLFS